VDSLFLLVALILVGLVGYMAYAKSQRDQRTFDRLYKPADAETPPDEHDLEDGGSISFEGDSDFVSHIFFMRAGKYKLVYTFPKEVQVKVELISVDGTDKEVIAIKSGEGEVGFSVHSDERYFCNVEPAKDEAWEIEIRRIGRDLSSG
jgi:hypothetical protein